MGKCRRAKPQTCAPWTRWKSRPNRFSRIEIRQSSRRRRPRSRFPLARRGPCRNHAGPEHIDFGYRCSKRGAIFDGCPAAIDRTHRNSALRRPSDSRAPSEPSWGRWRASPLLCGRIPRSNLRIPRCPRRHGAWLRRTNDGYAGLVVLGRSDPGPRPAQTGLDRYLSSAWDS